MSYIQHFNRVVENSGIHVEILYLFIMIDVYKSVQN